MLYGNKYRETTNIQLQLTKLRHIHLFQYVSMRQPKYCDTGSSGLSFFNATQILTIYRNTNTYPTASSKAKTGLTMLSVMVDGNIRALSLHMFNIDHCTVAGRHGHLNWRHHLNVRTIQQLGADRRVQLWSHRDLHRNVGNVR